MMSRLQILHLVGSAQDEFYCNLSLLYARDCLATIADRDRYEFHIAYVTPDHQWRFPASLDPVDIAATPSVEIAEAIATLKSKAIDVVIPQMFCLSGMTHYRSLLELLGVPYVGNTAEVMALGANKPAAKAIVAAAGVNVPKGECLRSMDVPSIQPPAVIKPSRADNSLGLAFVKSTAEYETALKRAFEYSTEVLVEDYIELGREVRCGILCKEDDLICLPLEEYPLDNATHPIRYHTDKLKQTESGELSLTPKGRQKSWIVDPSDPVTSAVHAAAKQCHKALNCRHYSLFDFRIDRQGIPWFLEAGLYCSFATNSVIAIMANAAGISTPELFEIAVQSALPLRK